MKYLRWRAVICVAVLILALAYALPNMSTIGSSALGKILPQDRINLGLDLKGGMDLTLGVDVEKAVQNSLVIAGRDMQMDAEDVTMLEPRLDTQGNLEVILPKPEQADAFRLFLGQYYPQMSVVDELERGGGLSFILTMTDMAKGEMESNILDQVVRTIRNRIDQFGVAEPDIRKKSDNQVQVQLPGLTDPGRAIQIIGQTAHLEFYIVRYDVDPNSLMLPPGTRVFPMVRKGPDGIEHETPIVLDTKLLMTGEEIEDARISYNEFGQPNVSINFSSRGGREFERITGENIDKNMAIVLDGKVYSAPTIQDRIAGGRASITGNFTVEEAQDLALVLRAGSLPAPVEILQERTVGPSLGQESIDSGILAALIGILGVMVIMPLYYGMSGLIADIMLCFTMTLLVGGMSAIGVTLTLPGIAGIVLTIGMAVDANVLIYERIREELKHSKPFEAINAGFSRATVAITDSNLTTIIVAAVLYQFGTGPVRGFAVTLTLGIIASMFTAIFVSKVVFQAWAYGNKRESISI